MPIYINGSFWGFAVATYKFSNFVTKFRFDKKSADGYIFGLSRTAPGTTNETFFYNTRKSLVNNIYAVKKVDRLNWNLYTIHASHPEHSINLLQLLFCLVAVSAVGYFIASLLKRPEVLKSHIQRQAIQLSESEIRFKQIFDSAPVGMAVINHQTRFITDVNKKFCELVGKDRDYILSGIKFSEFVSPEIYYDAMLEFQEMLKGNQDSVFRQHKHQKQDGSVSWTNVRINPLRNSEGVANQSLVMAEDITPAMTAMEELERSEIQFRNLFDESPIGKWEEDFSGAVEHLDELGLIGKDRKTVIDFFDRHPEEVLTTFGKIKVLNVNKAVLKLHETDDKEDLIKNPLKYLATPKAVSSFKELFASLCNGDTSARYETQTYTADGKLRDTSIKWHTVFGGERKYSHVIVAVDDISNTKMIFKALKSSEEKFKNLFDESPVAKWEEDFSDVLIYLYSLGLIGKDEKYVLDYFDNNPHEAGIAFSKVKIINVNRAVLEQHRVSSEEELFRNMTRLVITPKGTAVVKKILAAICNKEVSGEYESQIYTMDGELRDTMLKWHILPGGQSEYSQMIIATEDITERKKVTADLEDARSRLQTIINTIDGVVWTADPITRRINFISDKVKDITGYEKNDVLGVELFTNKSIDAKDKSRGAEIFNYNFEKLFPHTIEYRIKTKQGGLKWFQESISFIEENGKTDAILGIMVDITELKQSQTRLEESSARLELIIDNIDGVIWTADPGNMNYTFISNKAEELTGYKPSEWISKPMFCSLSMHTEDINSVMSDCRRNVEAGIVHDLEYRILTKQGETKWIRESIDFIRDTEGKIQSVIGIMVDLTDVHTSKVDLQKSLDIVMEQNKRLKNFSYIVSHNLRSHSSNIQSLCELIKFSEDEEEKNQLITHLGDIAYLLQNTMEGQS